METSYDVLRPDLPTELEELRELALDLRWSWSHVADDLWQRIDPELWHRTQNPWLTRIFHQKERQNLFNPL